MKKILISDFSKVLLFPKNNSYEGGLNKLYSQLGKEEDFNEYFELNESLLKELGALSVEKYIFTTGKVQDAPEIKDRVEAVFNKIFNVPMIGYKKTDQKAYLKLCDEIEIKPSQAMFIDDTEANVKAAKKAGLHAVTYESNGQILSAITDWMEQGS